MQAAEQVMTQVGALPGMSEDDITTASVSLQPQYSWNNTTQTSEITGYTFTQSLEVCVLGGVGGGVGGSTACGGHPCICLSLPPDGAVCATQHAAVLPTLLVTTEVATAQAPNGQPAHSCQNPSLQIKVANLTNDLLGQVIDTAVQAGGDNMRIDSVQVCSTASC